MKPTPVSANSKYPSGTSEKAGDKSSRDKKSGSIGKETLSIKDTMDTVQHEAHRKGSEQSKYSHSAPSPKSSVSKIPRDGLPARQESLSDPRLPAKAGKFDVIHKSAHKSDHKTADKRAGEDHAGKAGKGEKTERAEKGGTVEKHTRSEKSEKSEASGKSKKPSTSHSISGHSAARTRTTATTTTSTTTTTTTRHAPERHSSFSSSGEESIYQNVDRSAAQASGKPKNPPRDATKPEKNSRSSRTEKSLPLIKTTTPGKTSPPQALHKHLAKSHAAPYGAVTSTSRTATSTAAHTTTGTGRTGHVDIRRALSDDVSSTSSRRDRLPKHTAALGKSRSYTTSEKPYDDASFTNSESGALRLSRNPDSSLEEYMGKGFAAVKAVAWYAEESERIGMPIFRSRPGSPASGFGVEDDLSATSDSDEDNLVDSRPREKGYPPPIEFKPYPFLESDKFIAPAMAAAATGHTAQFKACIASMKQAMIAAGVSESSADYDEKFAIDLTDILMELMEHHPAARVRWFAEWMWSSAVCPVWKMTVPESILDYQLILHSWQHDRVKLDIFIEHCWRVGDGNAVTIFARSINKLTRVLTGAEPQPIQWDRPDLERPPQIPVECLALREQMKHVPPRIMEACRPGGDKAVTVGVARLVRDWISYLTSGCQDESLSRDQLHDYIKLACQHDSGHTIKTLLFTNLHPALGASSAIGARASILKTEDIRTHIKQTAAAFGAKKIIAYLQHWPDLMNLYMVEPAGNLFVDAYTVRLESLIGPPYLRLEPDEQDMDIPDPIAREAVRTSSH